MACRSFCGFQSLYGNGTYINNVSFVSSDKEETHIENDDCISCLEIDTQTASSRGEQKREIKRSSRIKVRNRLLACLRRNHAVQALVCETPEVHVVTQNI